LGAAGITEAVISALCLNHGLMPGTLNCRRVDPSLKSRILRENQTGSLSCVVSNIFGFGGNNCSLVFGKL
jgi:3-oxoacyl-[acyl-carrier-protein] synthase-1